MDMGTLQHNPSEFIQALSYQADLKKLPQLSGKLSSKFYQIVCIAPAALAARDRQRLVNEG
jgi:hypothetical protein